MRLTPIRVLPDEPAVDEIVRARVRSYARDKGRIHILEAGCGRRWPYRFHDVEFVLTGADICQSARSSPVAAPPSTGPFGNLGSV